MYTTMKDVSQDRWTSAFPRDSQTDLTLEALDTISSIISNTIGMNAVKEADARVRDIIDWLRLTLQSICAYSEEEANKSETTVGRRSFIDNVRAFFRLAEELESELANHTAYTLLMGKLHNEVEQALEAFESEAKRSPVKDIPDDARVGGVDRIPEKIVKCARIYEELKSAVDALGQDRLAIGFVNNVRTSQNGELFIGETYDYYGKLKVEDFFLAYGGTDIIIDIPVDAADRLQHDLSCIYDPSDSDNQVDLGASICQIARSLKDLQGYRILNTPYDGSINDSGLKKPSVCFSTLSHSGGETRSSAGCCTLILATESDPVQTMRYREVPERNIAERAVWIDSLAFFLSQTKKDERGRTVHSHFTEGDIADRVATITCGSLKGPWSSMKDSMFAVSNVLNPSVP